MEHKPKGCGILAQWALYNKFVKSRSKNLALMNLTVATMYFKDDQAKTRSVGVNGFTVQWGKFPYKSI